MSRPDDDITYSSMIIDKVVGPGMHDQEHGTEPNDDNPLLADGCEEMPTSVKIELL